MAATPEAMWLVKTPTTVQMVTKCSEPTALGLTPTTVQMWLVKTPTTAAGRQTTTVVSEDTDDAVNLAE